MAAWEWTVLSLYVGLLVFLSSFALHRLVLALAARPFMSVLAHADAFAAPSPLGGRVLRGPWPHVLVQLPLYNERCVAVRVIDAVCALSYPRARLTVQVLDDSTDDTTALVAEAVAVWSARGVAITHRRRAHRRGFKAGALAAGLRECNAELVAIFDADFLPPPDFLRRLVPEFRDPLVGMVQARWGHLNPHASLLARAQALLLDGHFVNEHGGRYARGCFFNFNGTCGVWRRACIEAAGGWSGRTLTEDLDLSYRAQLEGWRFVYRPDVVVPGELPTSAVSFKAQQHRWAKGSIETARHLLPALWRARHLPLSTRLEAVLHLTANAAYPAVLLLALLMPVAMAVRTASESVAVYLLDGALLLGSTGSLILFYALAARCVASQGGSYASIPLVLAAGVGLAVNNTRAVFEALAGRRSPFRRTPKVGHAGGRVSDAVHPPRVGWQAIAEILLGAYLCSAIGIAVAGGRYLALPFLLLFAGGFIWLGMAELLKSRVAAAFRGAPRPTAPPLLAVDGRAERRPAMGRHSDRAETSARRAGSA